jgi:hypothetical protein
MHSQAVINQSQESESAHEVIGRLRDSVRSGADWPEALLEAVARWSDPESEVDGRIYRYFIGGEAFDWLLLAERLCLEIDGLAPADEIEDLLFTGRLPQRFDESRFKEVLGGDKWRGYLNYFYGVTVEEALQVAVETEIFKRLLSNGNHYQVEVSDEGFRRIYRMTRTDLLKRFRADTGATRQRKMSLSDTKEFTYWLFKLRMMVSDKAKIASDTRKGLDQLARMTTAWRSRSLVTAGRGLS